MNVTSDEALQVLSTAHELGRAGRGELHAGLAERGLRREVVFRRGLQGQHTLTALDASGGADVLSEGTAHALRHTVSTGASGLLVLTEHVMRVGVDAEGVALGAGGVTNGRVANHTGCFERRVADLARVVGAQFEHNGETSRLSRTAVPNVELHDTVVGHTADVLASGVRRALDLAVHLRGLACHNGTSEQAADLNAAYEASDGQTTGHWREKA